MKTRLVMFEVDVPDHVKDEEIEETFANAIVDGMPVKTGWWINPRISIK